MNKDLFFEKIRENVNEYYKGIAIVSAHDVKKNNGTIKHGLCVTHLESNCGPTIYMDEMYEEYENGKSIEDIIDDIINIFEEHSVRNKIDLSFFKDFNKVYGKICYRLISTERNKELLTDVPYRIKADLAVVYFVSLEFMGIEGSILIRNEHMDMWGAEEEDLFEAALYNMPGMYPASFEPMENIIKSMLQCDEEEGNVFGKGLYVASNSKKIYGASVILYPDFLREVYDYIGGGFFILPSSIHEVIIMKDTHESEVAALTDIVRSVNSTCVSSEDFLSDSVYYYDGAVGGGENNVKKVEYRSGAMVL